MYELKIIIKNINIAYNNDVFFFQLKINILKVCYDIKCRKILKYITFKSYLTVFSVAT